MADDMPDLDRELVIVSLERSTGKVDVDYTGVNYLEAMSMLRIAHNKISGDALFDEITTEDEGDWDEESGL